MNRNYRTAATLCTLYTWFVSGTPWTSGDGDDDDEIQQ
jgi:hypothetical protein